MPQKQLSQFSSTPLYNIKAVEQATGVTASTLRVWERRYHVPTPNRNETGYRLYSEQDIATVAWLKTQLDEGLSISQAVARLEALQESGEDPVVSIGFSHATRPETGLRSLPILQDALVSALLDFQAARADEILAEAFALYPTESVALALIQPSLIEIGEGWHRGDVSIAQEHFASTFLRQKLSALFNYALHEQRAATIVCACAPGEMHEIGLLMLALFLRRRGYNVIYLGPNVPIDDLMTTLNQVHPALVCVSAASEETAKNLREIAQRVARLGQPHPIFGFGGRVFTLDPQRREGIPGLYLGDDAAKSADLIVQLVPV